MNVPAVADAISASLNVSASQKNSFPQLFA